MKKVIVEPSNYIQGNGEIKNLADYYLRYGSKKAHMIVDAFIKSKYEKEIIESLPKKELIMSLLFAVENVRMSKLQSILLLLTVQMLL